MRSGIALAAAALCLACGRTTEPVDIESAGHRVTAGDTVVLRFGESAALDDTARIMFSAVESDSRCPTDVTCVWAGDAHIRIDAVEGRSASQPLELHTTLEPREAGIAGFRIRLLDVTPARRSGDDVRPEDYSVRLAISRG